MINRKQIVLQGMQAAARMRAQEGIPLNASLCVYDLAERRGVDVRFEKMPSMEGFYLNQQSPVIVISALRPSGRRRFTCSHELGHHVFGHGTQYDELTEEKQEIRRSDPAEVLADAFGGALLMPKTAVAHGFQSREWSLSSPSPIELYNVATWLGVGYSTLITQMVVNHHFFGDSVATALRKHRPLDIRSEILGARCDSNLFVVDSRWTDRAVDLEVGDLLLVSPRCRWEGEVVTEYKDSAGQWRILTATSPGLARVFDPGSAWASFVRVSKREFAGLSVFRFDEGVPE
jgi:hypothetical protein